MSKNIQIPKSMFIDVYKLVHALQDYELDDNTAELAKRLETQINTKLDAMAKRELYTESKMGESASEREDARRKYLDAVGMPKDWRY